MKEKIIISTSITSNNGKRLAILYGSGGTRITGLKFTAISDNEINVPLNEREAKLLYDELGKILEKVKEAQDV
jgi:hypothetical protein